MERYGFEQEIVVKKLNLEIPEHLYTTVHLNTSTLLYT